MPFASPFLRILVITLAASLLPLPLPAAENLSLRWSELSPAVTGKPVWLSLPGGTRVTGVVHDITPDAMSLEIRKTSDSKTYPKGLASIPRSSVSVIRLTKPAGRKGLIIGAAVGGGFGAAAGVGLAAPLRNEGTLSFDGIVAAAILAPIGIGILVGALVDWTAHSRQRLITVRPD